MTAMSIQRAAALLFAGLLAITGCSGSDGKDGRDGTDGQPGASTGTLAGKVTIAGTSPALPVVGATVALSPAVSGVSITTNATGDYSAEVPVGVYTLTLSAANFTSQTRTVSVLAAQTATQNVALAATAPVVVALAATGTPAPGAALDVSATVTPLDGSTFQSIAWSSGPTLVAATFADPAAATTAATLPGNAAFKDELFRILDISPVLDPNADPNEGGTPLNATVQDRFKVQAINPFELERAGKVTLTATVTTTSGTFTASTVVGVALPFGVSSGVAQVPVNQPVVVHGKALAAPQTYSYSLAGPAGDATSLLDDPTSRNPMFTPTAPGRYTLTEATSGGTLDVHVGSWVGVIDPAATSLALDANGKGNPVPSTACTICHNGNIAPDKFTPWSQSGHAGIFTQNVNAGGHYTSACFDCHMVGFDEGAANGGVDDQSDFAAMLTGVFSNDGSPVADPFNWKTVLDSYPNTARMANIQCENCHGPQNVAGQDHTSAEIVAVRVSLDAGVCGRCHGEPARHGRYQEWSISGHANFTVAIQEGIDSQGAVRASCAGCHTAQGALQLFAQLKGGLASRTLTAASVANLAGLSKDNVEPQTCAVCHDPHFPGTGSGLANDVVPRVVDDTPLLPGGFKALGVGKGAVCITCHNSRNGEQTSGSGIVGLHEDGDPIWGTLTSFSAPHEACQGDVLMGRNAYFVAGVRGAHSFIPNACANCHMESVSPPPELGYPTGQTNHTFKADLGVCSKCHGSFDGAGLQTSVDAELAELRATVAATLRRLYAPAAATVVYTPGRTPKVSIDGAAAVNLSTFLTDAGASAGSTDLLAKTNWNYELVAGDSSRGVHNPSFVHEVLFRTTQVVNGLAVP